DFPRTNPTPRIPPTRLEQRTDDRIEGRPDEIGWHRVCANGTRAVLHGRKLCFLLHCFATCLTQVEDGPHYRVPSPDLCVAWRSHVSKTLLAVDDSSTMRKVLEITFT